MTCQWVLSTSRVYNFIYFQKHVSRNWDNKAKKGSVAKTCERDKIKQSWICLIKDIAELYYTCQSAQQRDWI